MKKLLAASLLALSLPILAMAASHPELDARAVAVGAPTYSEWATGGNVFWAGYEGFVDMCTNYLTEENVAKVLEEKAYTPWAIDHAINGSGQSVSQWIKVNPWG